MRYTNDPEIEGQIGAFGKNMRVARKRAGLTQTQLAALDGLDRAAISLTEKGKRSPDMRTLLRIASGLQVQADELLEGIGDFRPAEDGDKPAVPGSRSKGRRSGDRFSENLHRARRCAGISQQALGLSADVDAAAISLYERGQRQPNLRTVLKLARTLKISPVDLLKGVG
jgi:transcriptional regulator with XRE-family HTH domain